VVLPWWLHCFLHVESVRVWKASPRIQMDDSLVKDIADKLDRGNVTESVFDAVQAKVVCCPSVVGFSLQYFLCLSLG